jgi:hypothetical protein
MLNNCTFARMKKHNVKQAIALLVAVISLQSVIAQPDRWQQRVKYNMDINMDVATNRFTGVQKLEYTNNSPDTLYRVFYHLYFNAFQPNSMMDARSRWFDPADQDSRVRDRIYKLKPEEIGYQKITSLKMNGSPVTYTVKETILEVKLQKPILPRSKVTFDMNFEAQVPLQIRRSGRDNPSTGVRYSMSQWYPKMCEYDYEGWHPTPYVAREFYGVWGDYDVKITIDKSYVIGGTGYLTNANQIGYGYETPGTKVPAPSGSKLTWNFTAPNVHDFMWAADPEFKHISRQAVHGTTINVLYNRDLTQWEKAYNSLPSSQRSRFPTFADYTKSQDDQWAKIADAAVTVLPFIEKNFGEYPYKQYSFVHGGDGGMEYPMSTLISSASLGTAFHEWMHTWYQMLLGTNEGMYPWMDEGFTSYASTLVSGYYQSQTNNPVTSTGVSTGPKKDPADTIPNGNAHRSAYTSYFGLVRSGLEEPMTTHSDHYNTNRAYSTAAYSKGEVFMEQLGYIIGAQVRDKVLLEYYRQWRFKHPNVNDLIRVAEKVSDIKLDWYREYFVNTTKMINYGIDSLWEEGGKTKIRLKNSGFMPMPIDLQLTLKDGSKALHYIPMYLMFGQKPVEFPAVPRTVHEDWKWTHPTYTLDIDKKLSDISVIEIDPTQRMADVNRSDNKLELKW